jgi:phosphoribosylanthranilate isomerase
VTARTQIKVCGVTLADDAARISAAGVELIGLNFWKRSKRYLDPARAPIVAGAARGAGEVRIVGLFVDADHEDIVRLADELALDAIQVHGDDSPQEIAALAAATKRPIWKALSVAAPRDVEHLHIWPVEAVLLDAPTPARGGAGVAFDHALAVEARRRHPTRKIVLAGGLTPDNVAAAIVLVDPWCVDVATGVEAAPGIKDPGKLAAFVAAVRASAPR